MKNKVILLLAMSLVLTLCGDGGEETASNVVIDDAECLSTTEIEEINKNIIENGIQLGELKSRDGNTATPEELMTEIEILRNELSSNDGVGENEDNLNKTILRLEEKLGITYEEVDFDNFGQDSILEELYDGTINPLESRDSLTAEEQDQLNLARDKAGLLDATLNRYILKKGNFPRILEIEERILELEGQIENFSPSSQTVEEIEDYIAAQEIILSTTPPCSDLVLSASESDEENESSIGQYLTSDLERAGCYEIQVFNEFVGSRKKLEEFKLDIEGHLLKRMEPIPSNENIEEYENNNSGDFIETIPWDENLTAESIEELRNLFRGFTNYDRLSPTDDGLKFINSYLLQVNKKVEILNTRLLPLCGGSDVGKVTDLSSDEESSLSYDTKRPLSINRLCDVDTSNLNCSDPLLYIPQKAASCDASATDGSYTNPAVVERFFPSDSSNSKWLRASYGTRYTSGSGQAVNTLENPRYDTYFNPEIIFPDEATKVTIIDDASNRKGILKSEFSDQFLSTHNGISEKAYVYDDGTHGDQVAGDGVYTNNCITLAKDYAFNDKNYIQISKLHVLNPSLRNSIDIFQVSENVVMTDSGIFLNIGYDYTQYNNFNNPIVFTPNDDALVYRYIFELFDDNIHTIVISPREDFSRGHMMRLNDHIRGTGFYHDYYINNNQPAPAQSTDIKAGLWSDGKAHMELQAVVMMGNPKMGAFLHEYEHSIFGQADGGIKDPFPGPKWASLSYPDYMHLTPYTTAINSLQGDFKILQPDGRSYKNVKISKGGETFGTRIINENGKFKAVPSDSLNKVTSDIFLYAAGVLEASEVKETYYHLVDVSINGCLETINDFICDENNEVKAMEVIEWTVDDYINHFGPRSYAYGNEPEKFNLAVANIAERPFSEAEIIFKDGILDNIVDSNPGNKWRDHKLSMSWRWSGLENVNLNMKELLMNSESYLNMPKVETSSIKYGDILVSDIDLYKELYFRALEEDSAELIQKAIDLIPTIPYGYLAKSFLIEEPSEAYSLTNTAYDATKKSLLQNTFSSSALLSRILNTRVDLNNEYSFDNNQLALDLKELRELSSAEGWFSVSEGKQYRDELGSKVCFSNKEQLNIELKDCELENIAQDPDQLSGVDSINPIWFDKNLSDFIAAHNIIASGYRQIADGYLEIENKEKVSLNFYLKATEIIKEGISFDSSDVHTRFSYAILMNIYGENLAEHPTASKDEKEIFKALGQYYFIKERNAMGGQCERYKGTFFSGGLVGGEDGRYYMADYFCNRPKVYEPEDGSTYTFNYHTWEFVKAS
ncbi:hypothetical protein OAQ50_03670 [Acidimicrobiia bacterium]|nr:hypothetical protein [Acidimicrobiia bacterium]